VAVDNYIKALLLSGIVYTGLFPYLHNTLQNFNSHSWCHITCHTLSNMSGMTVVFTGGTGQ